ncbi:putative metalloprotease CJM1_0395 family protein [Campylobacter novaezeelandiae]|uniref:putative metalloprotease CJM1_0395 family protein n=1 Tax=Campylobacter novaezeelandiae TaxID=2267891 RepID=UPI001908684F|nr:putative metalloprotease CJM1_0395 family protein [Campylobacter novaezeelandiae]MBK1964336.1 hypothetical protein [Campylobacter novaezeelandiae]MBK1993320.1 hypothetical protein [Campylobacter novaezeelandiae]
MNINFNTNYSLNLAQQNSSNKALNNKDKNEDDTQKQVVNGLELDAKQIQQLRELQSTDREVKAHEAAHQAAGGSLAGGASYSYVKGPDNQMYAASGEVPIRMQKGNTPDETIANARQIASAAMAPANPSPQDYKVAANALKLEMEARSEAVKLKAEKNIQDKKDKEQNENTNKTENNKDFKNFVSNIYKNNSLDLSLNFNIAS